LMIIIAVVLNILFKQIIGKFVKCLLGTCQLPLNSWKCLCFCFLI
jgi:hypothetical protein